MTLDVDQGPGLQINQPLTSIGVLDAWGRPCMKLGCRRRSKPPPAGSHTCERTHPSAINPSRSTYTVDRSSCHWFFNPREQPRRHPRHSRQQASMPVLRKSGSAFAPEHDQPHFTPACDQIPQSEPPTASLRSSKPPSVSTLARNPNPQSSTRACSIYTHQSPSAGNHTGDSTSNRKPRLDLFHIRASSSALKSESSADESTSIAPLQLESPVGQFLFEILLSYPHLVPATIDLQLHLIQPACDEDKSNDESSSSGTKLVLHRRIVELKANGRRRALENIICYSEDEKMVQLHSHETYEMSKNHLALILVLHHLFIIQNLSEPNLIQEFREQHFRCRFTRSSSSARYHSSIQDPASASVRDTSAH
ncbi:hypothetical protein MA16_Dca009222 [Dendrobium catenatum]|uniref:Uncharacterized protein n=1 Tax=Dendrobium catenatum TaxID=906689 RepID=A0A2I0VR84_9ASPA|nr:hypothetical protein MA16_Dca009222 [Dendrobium catenatum]